MPVDLDDDAPPPAPSAEEAELARGQFAYETMRDLLAELDAGDVMAVVSAVQARRDWQKVPRNVREVFEDLEAELFDDGEAE